MLVVNNKLLRIDRSDIINGVFTAPDNVLYVGSNLSCDDVIKMVLPNVLEVGHSFLYWNKSLISLDIPNVTYIDENFMYFNRSLVYLNCPKLEIIGDFFLFSNEKLNGISIPNIKEIGDCFIPNHTKIEYNSRMIKALKFDLFVGGSYVEKVDYIRSIKIRKLL